MIRQGVLFDVLERDVDREPEAPPHNGTPTSKAAAESVRDRVAGDAARILEAIRLRGADGLTCDEIEMGLDYSHQTASARCRGLAQKGLIADSGRTRKTRTGRAAICWIATVTR